MPTINNLHVTEAIGLYLAALQMDPTNVTALDGLLGLYVRAGRRVEGMEIADRILALHARDVAALQAMAL